MCLAQGPQRPDLLNPCYDRGCRKPLANKCIAHQSHINRKSLLRLRVEQCSIDKINHIHPINLIFCNLEGGGYGGPPPKKFENQESGRSHLWSIFKNNFTFSK